MMQKLFILIMAGLLLFFSTGLASAGNKELAQEVMAIHDVAMAKMTDMHELRLQLQALEKTSGSTEEISTAIADLKNAHNSMMQWMREYKPPKTEQEFSQAEPYLLVEKEKISKVGEAIDESIANAEKLLGK